MRWPSDRIPNRRNVWRLDNAAATRLTTPVTTRTQVQVPLLSVANTLVPTIVVRTTTGIPICTERRRS